MLFRSALDAGQQNVSKHLGVLADAGIVGRRRDGNKVFYAIADESVLSICETVCGTVEQQLRELHRLIAPTGSLQ